MAFSFAGTLGERACAPLMRIKFREARAGALVVTTMGGF
jgi:hypothetical protein